MAIFRPNNGYFWNERQSGGLWTQLEIFEKKIEFLDAKKNLNDLLSDFRAENLRLKILADLIFSCFSRSIMNYPKNSDYKVKLG